jgi:hypothetical protein
MSEFTRRDTLKQITVAGTAAVASSLSKGLAATAEKPLPGAIADENAKPGTRDWMLGKTKIDPDTKYRCPWVEGYASKASVRAGESISFHVSTLEDSPFTIDLYRLGYYQGKGGRLMKPLGSFAGKTQADPPVGAKRVRICDWEPCAELTIPQDWLSGVYVGKITASKSGLQSYLVFIVRDDRKADYIFQCSDNTWQAYNRWPSQFALYDNGKHQWFWGKDVQVSYNRPYGKYCQIMDAPLSTGSGEYFLWEFPFAYWMESLGYDLTYVSNMDTHHDGEGLMRAKGFLSVGHDEYWTIEMYRNVKKAIDGGLNVGFFSGNAVCGRVVFDENSRAFERVGVFGPPGGTRDFEQMKSLEHVPPYGNTLMGAHSTGPVTGGADWVCNTPDHWIYAGTGMKKGDRVPGVIGWEWHGDPAEIPGLEIVATDTTQSAPGKPNGGVYTATVYPGPKDNFVFNASTCWWADGLSEPPGYVRPKAYIEPKGPDSRIQRITSNILRRMVAG